MIPPIGRGGKPLRIGAGDSNDIKLSSFAFSLFDCRRGII
jgi:hypothetical protein